MTEAMIIDMAREVLWTIVKTSAPLLIISDSRSVSLISRNSCKSWSRVCLNINVLSGLMPASRASSCFTSPDINGCTAVSLYVNGYDDASSYYNINAI